MKPILTLVTGAAVAALLSGCGNMYHYERTTDRGSTPFNQALASEYKDLWTYEAKEMYDWIDAEHFAFKSQSAARGETPLPARVENWNVQPRYKADLQQGRERLVRALDGGGRDRAPRLAARAQVAYDCWMEQQEENWQLDHIAACRTDYEKAIAALEGALAPRPIAQAAPPTTPAQPAPAPANELRVFFDWDRSTLDQTALQVIDTATRQMRSAFSGGTPGATAGSSAGAGLPTFVLIEGHADKSGPNDYNMGLSERRAEAVRQALIQRGWPADRIEMRAFGEEAPLVETQDGVREPANRRVRVTIQNR